MSMIDSQEALKQAREQGRTCAFCYYQDFDVDAYPCSRCICNEPTENMWKPKEQEIAKSLAVIANKMKEQEHE